MQVTEFLARAYIYLVTLKKNKRCFKMKIEEHFIIQIIAPIDNGI